MNIVLNREVGIRFIKYLISYIYNIANNIIDVKRCKNIDTEFNIDSKQIILFEIKNLSISSTSIDYIIRIDNNLKYNHMNLGKLINLITYGNRDVKGYNIISNIFTLIKDDLPNIYERWLNNGN